MGLIDKANRKLNKLSQIMKQNQVFQEDNEELKVGIDLGTANLVLTAVNGTGEPVWGESISGKVVRDGLVVDYMKAINIVRDLKKNFEEVLGTEIRKAATAVPPGTSEGNQEVFENVVEGVGLKVTNVVDEPIAAASVLGIENGVVVDIGGGTTGISVLKDQEVVYTADEATGGIHLDLVIAGSLNISVEKACKIKKDEERHDEIFNLVTPVINKIAAIVNNHVKKYDVEDIYLVGGTSSIKGIEDILEKKTGLRTIKTAHPLLVTPLGIALNC